MPVPQQVADQILSDCGRRCCLCRRFEPLRLQVHHIKPQAEGGTDDPANLIALCLNCHSSVHTKACLARNFTDEELKQHRDNTLRLVREGRLVGDGEVPGAFDEALKRFAAIFLGLEPSLTPRVELLPEAVEVLVAAARYGGLLYSVQYDGGWALQCGQAQFGGGLNDHRRMVKYQKAFSQLGCAGLVEQVREDLWQVTYDGYVVADQLIAAAKLRADV